MIFSNACCFKLYECLFTVSVVDRHFSFPYFEKCGVNIVGEIYKYQWVIKNKQKTVID